MTRHLVHASRVAVAKAGSADGVHRLEEIEVQEVSLVDRPANKRAFLIVKRSDEMTTQVTPDGKGGFTAANGTAKAGPPPMPPGAGVPPGEAAAPPGKKKPKAVGKLDVPPGFKEMMAPMLAKAAEALAALADAVDGSTPVDIGDDGEMPMVPGEFSDALNGIMTTLDKLAGMWPSSSGGDMDAGADAADAAEEPPMPSDMQMRAALDNIGKVLGHSGVTKAAIAKVGAKMAKDRFARLQTAYDQLGSLIGELGPQIAPAAAPPGGALKSATAKSDVADPNAAIMKALEAMLAPIVASVSAVGAVVKKQNADIATLQKSRNGGNASRVEKSGSREPAPDLSWPLDMNSPVTKETVSKTESFFGNND